MLPQLPRGLDTDIRERGVNLSGGQKQRLALARGLIAARNSSLLLLDEPTSSVDLATEGVIFDRLFTAMADKTIVASIHRFHLLPRFDEIGVMKEGAMIEQGSFNDLLARGGEFARLWASIKCPRMPAQGEASDGKETAPAPRKKPVEADERRYPLRPIAGVGIVIWRGDKVLLVKRGQPPRKGEWSLPGGMQRLGETIMQAAVREAREETGLDIMPLGIVTALDGITRDAKNKIEYHYTIVEVAAESREGDAEAKDDVDDLRWALVEEIDKICRWPEVARVVRLSLLQRAF